MSGKLTYKQSGVDTKEAQAFVSDISTHVKRTQQNRKLHQAFGLFAAAYDLSSYSEPVIVTGCDGVGTKTEILFELDMLETAGKDLVAMNVNDILTTGGDPLLFLDYLGISNLETERPRITRLVAGMCDYLQDCNCILAGGETAEMPGVVPENIVELSGFCIGCAEKKDLIDPTTVTTGDILIGYKSDGFHANGWSLVRRVIEENPDVISESDLRTLLAPTRLYHDVVNDMRSMNIIPKAYAHITGGGLPENLERFLGDYGADLVIPAWDNEGAQKILAYVDEHDRFNTFNMGIGWVAIVKPEDVEQAVKAGPGGTVIGTLRPGHGINVTVK
ncbi:phosphoribosylformylglycinamidine cyclo-ligase [Akkermansia glycaniphila]|uniref:Phosphoribosylformylglycinamidine cyclo-ligase n=1 Tax=Akkermansia glycaniphila TaxID=1679444 RepID=A0A1C7PB68_9BACT|nr:phosphoribosylformylglycinamidine cyclo-ligase [Akkermansia glycaniphila]OCA02813.1 phosphoribosylaminoimidazole synthetase [Akkermansia glycaniphila]SEH76204.1 purm: phosphoribosylformylglycinamidine cyclo-ligase [Akkermansia glycaniphila]